MFETTTTKLWRAYENPLVSLKAEALKPWFVMGSYLCGGRWWRLIRHIFLRSCLVDNFQMPLLVESTIGSISANGCTLDDWIWVIQNYPRTSTIGLHTPETWLAGSPKKSAIMPKEDHLNQNQSSIIFCSMLIFQGVHPQNLTWNLKITCLKRKLIFQTFIFCSMLIFQGVYLNEFFPCLKTSLGLVQVFRGPKAWGYPPNTGGGKNPRLADVVCEKSSWYETPKPETQIYLEDHPS